MQSVSPSSANSLAARQVAANVEDLESHGDWQGARDGHREVARLFRLASVSADEQGAQQLRMLARHHETRAQFCETQMKQQQQAAPSSTTTSSSVDKTTSFSPQLISPKPKEPTKLPPEVEDGWDLWKPLENLFDRIFPKELFGTPPSKDTSAQTFYMEGDEVNNKDEEDDDEENNNMMESFYVLPDYQGGERLPEARPRSSSSLVTPQPNPSVPSESDQMSLLMERCSMLEQQNAMLQAKVKELEAERMQMRQSVMQFREELEKSVIGGNNGNNNVNTYPHGGGGGDAPVGRMMRSMMALQHQRSPSPDMHEYIRGLERKVEQQQRRLDEWQQYAREEKRKG